MQIKKLDRLTHFFFWTYMITLLAFVKPGHTETQYVTDMLLLTLRDGPGNEFKVIRTLRTAMALEILEEQEKFARVRTEDGEEGWVAKQYLTLETPKTVVIDQLNEQIKKLGNKVEQMEQSRKTLNARLEDNTEEQSSKIQQLESSITKYRDEAAMLEKKMKDMKEKYDTLSANATDAVGLMVERDRLRQQNKELEIFKKELDKDIAEIEGENQRLTRNEILHWFLAGSAVFFVGLMVGKLSRKRKPY